MGKALKILGWIALAMGVLAVLLVAAVALFFDPNQFRDKVTRVVKNNTGRELSIGDIRVSVFPTLGARIKNARFSNAAGFGDQPFASVSEAAVGVQLLPLLLRRDIEVGSVTVDGLQLNLARHADGKTNWDDLAGHENQMPQTAPNEPVTPQSGNGIHSINIGAIGISNAVLAFRDNKAGKTYTLSELKLSTGSITPGKPFDFDLAFTTALGELIGTQGIAADSEISATLAVDLAAKNFEAKNLKVKLEATGNEIPGGKQKAELDADLQFDSAKGDFKLENARLDVAGLKAETSLLGSGFNGDAPYFSGPLTIKPFSPREVLKAFAIPLETTDSSALKQASLSTQIEGGEKSANLTNFQLMLDETHITGSFAIRDFATQAIEFALKLDHIDADRYMPPAKTGASPKTGAPSPKKDSDAKPIPVDALDKLNASGTFDVGSLKLQGMSLTDAHLKLAAPKGSDKHIDLTAKLYGGTMNSSTRIATGAHPTYAEMLKLASVSIGPLLKDFNGKDKISGEGNIGLDITSGGRTVGEAKRTLNGDLSFDIKNGAVKGFNLAQIVRRGQSLLNGQAFGDDSTTTGQQTDFSALTGSGKFVNGVLHADQLDAQSPLFRLSGAGTVDLVNRTLDYLLKPTFVNSMTGQGGKSLDQTSGVTIPVHVTGGFDQPHYAIDVKSALEQKAAQKLIERVQNGKLGGKINDALGKLFGNKKQDSQTPQQNAPNP